MWKNLKMEVLRFSVVLCICKVNCEWVEITPIVNKKPEAIVETKPIFRTTTASTTYEDIMTTPFLKSDYTFTTPNNLTNYQTEVDVTTDFVNIETTTYLPPTDSTELNTPFVTTEEYSEEKQEDEDDNTEESNDFTYKGFFPFLRLIQNNLLKYKNKSRRSKMSILKHLRDQLQVNIKDRITNYWFPAEAKFEARGYKDEDEGHMDFPSNEGALMTIGFLTFAVFLIKLIIKLVYALKYKQQYYVMSTTTTPSSVVFLKRKKREDIGYEEAAKILQYIEEYNFS